MAFIFTTLLQVLVEEVVEVAVVATAVAATTVVAFKAIEIGGRTINYLVDEFATLSVPTSNSTNTSTYLGERTIHEWWLDGITSEERQLLLKKGYSDKTGCFTLDNLKNIICYAKAPGKPTEKNGYEKPKNWDGKLKKAPKSNRKGYPDRKGSVWVPTGENSDNPNSHGGPHWDVEHPDGSYDNVYPDGKVRPGKR
ncbi:3085_t:CDS:1 [Funneliformis mosseae]|uniref:3085_t:CDS:1 n=1 Tax=Funneliformis mosseae TaxID=27381 RepID=A0A9N8ZXK9_FUNMO|nr:3085_t:CDS:1 [Funneliformis mosseae]